MVLVGYSTQLAWRLFWGGFQQSQDFTETVEFIDLTKQIYSPLVTLF